MKQESSSTGFLFHSQTLESARLQEVTARDERLNKSGVEIPGIQHRATAE
jgi:hypothetical protein